MRYIYFALTPSYRHNKVLNHFSVPYTRDSSYPCLSSTFTTHSPQIIEIHVTINKTHPTHFFLVGVPAHTLHKLPRGMCGTHALSSHFIHSNLNLTLHGHGSEANVDSHSLQIKTNTETTCVLEQISVSVPSCFIY